MSDLTALVLREIQAERERQDIKWGQQDHDFGTWLQILMEEIGEASKDNLDGRDPRGELIQCAAVLVNWIESLIRRATP
jgi:hypothetical protein